MALIELNKQRKSSGAYLRMIGDNDIANLVTAIQAAVISNGHQTSQKLIKSYYGNLPVFYGKDVNTPLKTLKVLKQNPNGVILFNCYVKDKLGKKQEVDVLVFDGKKIFLGEVKEGNNLDTKKSESEIDGIEYAANYFLVNKFEAECGLILMNMVNGQHSIKDDRADKYVMSGEFFCKNYRFDFQKFLDFEINESLHNKELILNEFKKILKEHDRL